MDQVGHSTNKLRRDRCPHDQVVVATPVADPELWTALAQTYGDALRLVVEDTGKAVNCESTDDPEGGSRYNCTPYRGSIEAQTVAGQHPGDAR